MLLLMVVALLRLPTAARAACPSDLQFSCSCTLAESQLSVRCSMKSLQEVTSALSSSGMIGMVHSLDLRFSEDLILPENFTQSFPSLSILKLLSGSLSTIEPGAFTGSPSLSVLDLRGNDLTVLSGAMLAGIPAGLQQLLLDQNDIQYLLQDLEPLFLSVTNTISLSGNSIQCSCHIRWLADLLLSTNSSLPAVSGAFCMHTSGLTSLTDSALNTSSCSNLCSLGIYPCPLNQTCVWEQGDDLYNCNIDSPMLSAESISPSPSPIATSPVMMTITAAPPTPTPTSTSSTSATPTSMVSMSVALLQALLAEAEEGGSTDLNYFAEQLNSVVSSGNLSDEDIPSLIQLLSSAAQLLQDEPNVSTAETLLKAASAFLDLDQLKQLNQPSESILNLFQGITSLGEAIPIPEEGGSVTLATSNIVLLVAVPSPNITGWNVSSSLLLSHDANGETSVHIPASIIENALQGQSLDKCNVRLLVSLWSVNTSLLQVNSSEDATPIALANGICDWSRGSRMSNSTLEVNSMVVSISLSSNDNCTLNTTHFNDSIIITLHHINSSYTQPSCAVLNEEEERGTDWMRSSCSLVTAETNYTVCACNHLTTFALLMNPSGTLTASLPLLIATKVGLCVSIVALLITIILLFSLRLEGEQHHLHRQLALALCLSQVVFLVGVDRRAVPTPDAVCTLIAALLHYLLLCTFAWQLVEGVHLYLYVVKVFYNSKIVWVYYPLAWGCPLVIVAVTLGIRFCDYGSQDYCWITTASGANWAFHGPVLAVISANVILLLVVIIVIIRAVRRRDPERCIFCILLQASIVLLPCLGITWVLGILLVVAEDPLYREIVEYIFLIFVTLQGLAIFLVHCLLNTEVRSAFLKAIGCREAAKKQRSIFAFKQSVSSSQLSKQIQGIWKRRLSVPEKQGITSLPTHDQMSTYTSFASAGAMPLETIVEEEESNTETTPAMSLHPTEENSS